jgi:hypothetical protein
MLVGGGVLIGRDLGFRQIVPNRLIDQLSIPNRKSVDEADAPERRPIGPLSILSARLSEEWEEIVAALLRA